MTAHHITIDIGGEGRHQGVWNVNTTTHCTIGALCGQAIPRLVLARGEALPFADQSVQCILVERAPLGAATLREIARIVAPGGRVILRHVAFGHADRHSLARRLLCAESLQRHFSWGKQRVVETVFSIVADDPCREDAL